MSKRYLDSDGLAYVWGKIKRHLAKKQDVLKGAAGQVVGFDADGNAVAQAAPAGGVTSFKGRAGAVMPRAGDYTADQVGALPQSGGTVSGTLTLGSGGIILATTYPGTVSAKIRGGEIFFKDDNDKNVMLSGISDPVVDSGAATKKYVDDLFRAAAPVVVKIELMGERNEILKTYHAKAYSADAEIQAYSLNLTLGYMEGNLRNIVIYAPQGYAFSGMYSSSGLFMDLSGSLNGRYNLRLNGDQITSAITFSDFSGEITLSGSFVLEVE